MFDIEAIKNELNRFGQEKPENFGLTSNVSFSQFSFSLPVSLKCEHNLTSHDNSSDRWKMYITRNNEICDGEPIIEGTRILVANIIELHLLGLDIKEIREAYPHLSEKQIIAAFDYYNDPKNKKEINEFIEEERRIDS